MQKQPRRLDSRLDPQYQLSIIQKSNFKPQEFTIFYQLVPSSGSSYRQLLKNLKKIIENHSESITLKDKCIIQINQSFIAKHFTTLFIKQFIYGITESKPIMSNILIKVARLANINHQTIANIVISFGITNFQEARHATDLLNLISTFTQINQASQNQLKMHMAIENTLLSHWSQGLKLILDQNFKNKWLQQFVDLCRSINTYFKLCKEPPTSFIDDIHQLLKKFQLLSKQVLSQLYFLLIYLNREQKQPAHMLLYVHFWHAKSVVQNLDNLSELMHILPSLRQIEYRCQFVPLLAQSFQKYYQDYKKKQQVFDQVISLFEAGRAIYSSLQDILNIILRDNPVNWNLEGQYSKKFFICTVVLKHCQTQSVLCKWPTLIIDIMKQSGNINSPYSLQCAKILLKKLYSQSNQNFQKWAQKWYYAYEHCLFKSNSKNHIRGIVQFITPILLEIDSSAELLQKILSIPRDFESDGNVQTALITVLKCYKDIGRIKIDGNNNVFVYFSDKQEYKKVGKRKDKGKQSVKCKQILHKQLKEQKQAKQLIQANKKIQENNNDKVLQIKQNRKKQFSFSTDIIKNLLLSQNTLVSLKSFQFITNDLKIARIIEPVQFQLILTFYSHSLKTSQPQFRKSYLTATKKLFQRFNTIYEDELRPKDAKNKIKEGQRKTKLYYEQFKIFLHDLIQLCYDQVFPDAIFEQINPALEILLLIVTFFGPFQNQYKKGQIFAPSNILTNLNFFRLEKFQNLLTCLQSSYESVRQTGSQLLNKFTSLSQNSQWLVQLWKQSLKNANKLAIKSYEHACRVLCFIGINYHSVINQINHDQSKMSELVLMKYFLNLLQTKYVIFRQEFTREKSRYYQNLVHGLLTCLSYVLEILAKNINKNSQKYQKDYHQLKVFLEELFQTISQILQFSVEVCSSNISTVVLDTLPQSQTDRQFKVDCRGHFLNYFDSENLSSANEDLTQNSVKRQSPSNSIGSKLASTSLMSAMNEQQGIENNLVVSFYLLTRQAGLLFQSIASLFSRAESVKYLPNAHFVRLIQDYFYALVNLKHMGSVDRIANGLGRMAIVFFAFADEELARLPEILLDKLLNSLRESKFANILRRSAGVPYAFSCLLRTQGVRRRQIITNTIQTLLAMSQKIVGVAQKSSQSKIQLRVHALNILKKLFQDSDLKGDIQSYLSLAFMTSMEGFSSEEWGVRNSSLMLFSVLANRTVGLKPNINLLEFFHKCPQLLPYITNKLSKIQIDTMYPSLYPIALLLSRLLPFQVRKPYRGGEGNSKQIRKEQLLQLRPLIEQAGRNNNFMGRVMTAKAVLPFMDVEDILDYCLQNFNNIDSHVKDNNFLHFQLTKIHHLLSFCAESLQQQNSSIQNKYQSKITPPLKTLKKILEILKNELKYFTLIKSSINRSLFVKINILLIKNYRKDLIAVISNLGDFISIIKSFVSHINKCLQGELQGDQWFNISMDMGHSSLRQIFYQFLDLLELECLETVPVGYSYFVKSLAYKLKSDQRFLQKADCGFICFRLQQILHLGSQANLNAQMKIKTQISRTESKQFQFISEEFNNILDVLDTINLEKINNQSILILLLKIKTLQTKPRNYEKLVDLVDYLYSISMKTQNHFLKIAIFNFLPTDCKHVKKMLQKFSQPDQLQELRQCCVEHLQKCKTLHQNKLLICIRLLEDQQFQIRRQSSKVITRLLNSQLQARETTSTKNPSQKFQVYQHHEQYLKNKILCKLSVTQFMVLLCLGDYEIKQRNNNQSRIFSNDKPNKYRCDITNILFALIHNPHLLSDPSSLCQNILLLHDSKWIMTAIEEFIRYRDDALSRNQYQFETVLRLFLVSRILKCEGLTQEDFKVVMQSQGLLSKVYERYSEKIALF